MSLFDVYIDEIIGIEGGFSDHKSDSGGATKYGITLATARRYGYKGSMQELPKSLAKQIYKERYWAPLGLDDIEKISPSIVRELLDTGINQGVGRASEYLQIALNALNRRQKDYPDIRVDGDIGPITIRTLKAYLSKRYDEGEIVLMRALNCLQGSFYITLSQNRKKDEDFLYGWLLHRVVI